MNKSNSHTDTIFNSLETAGFPRNFQHTLLPDWVTSEVLSDSAASSEIAAILAKRLGLRVSPLLSENPKVESLRRPESEIKYKRSIPSRKRNLTAATSVAVSIANSIASACHVEFQPFASRADTLRAEVLTTFPGKWLGLKNLLMACWSHGVPVICLADIGPEIPKMDGMVIHTGERPVIVLSKSSPLWAWQGFILAHEIAHIALRHVGVDEILIDEELSDISYALQDEDLEERSADQFAIELLNGRPEATYKVSAKRVNSIGLAKAALELGKVNQVDPGHIVLNFAHKSEKWGVGIKAAQLFQDGQPTAFEIIGEAMWREIDSSFLPSETVEFIGRVTGSKRQQ